MFGKPRPLTSCERELYSPYALVTADDPPVYMYYIAPPGLGQNQKDPTHTSNFGVKLQERCRAIGVECELVYPGAPQVKHRTIEEFFIDKLSLRRRQRKGIANRGVGRSCFSFHCSGFAAVTCRDTDRPSAACERFPFVVNRWR
jgi:hypothetical protein